jgi:hypothetical protein
MPAYVHPAGFKVSFPSPTSFRIEMPDRRCDDAPLYMEIPEGQHPLYGALILSTLGLVSVPAEALRTEDEGLMIYTEDPGGEITFSELPKAWGDALAYEHQNYKVFIDGPKVWLLNPAGMQLEVPIRYLNVPETCSRPAGAGILQIIAGLQGLDLTIPDGDFEVPGGGRLMVARLTDGGAMQIESGDSPTLH